MKITVLGWFLFMISVYSVKAQNNFALDLNFKTQPTEKITLNETSIGLSFSKKINAKNKFSNTLNYTNLNVKYSLLNFESLQNLNRFNQFQNKLEFSHQFSNTTQFNLEVTPTANFEQDFDFSVVSVLGSLNVVQQLGLNTNFTIGAARTTAFGLPKLLPVASFYHKINNESSLLIGFPYSKISYSNNIRNTFSLTNHFNGNFYYLDVQNSLSGSGTKASLSQITTALEYQRNMDENWFMVFKAGYDFDKKYILTDQNNHKTYDFNIDNGYLFSIGIKYKH
ncbi:hypothetical protein GON26_14575 [Flavobacterium sp. GA093]|uniref:DUF6268 domain-containing protein n=1 Tax=Flavobacterium hydrocarbonoxydans TaxID=2683249 RepID=A0A6I4NND6_9FLAO|nr:DUF6268 family outer membrane beta-barrel protein [Flavobacterium hydrocarbonoxydans]MWB95591.1 hypothetical protein [Flavobacterium hydrocarbonoxydans]